jgi:Tol biopolymer transport system component
VLGLKNDLAELEREVKSGEVLSSDALPPVSGEEPRPSSPALAVGKAAIGLAAVLLLSVAGWLYISREPTPGPHVPIRSIPVTSWPGSELDPALSPRGEHVAFVWDGETEGRFDLYVMLPGGGAPLRLTEGPASVRHPTWSPDGLEIAFLQQIDPSGNRIVAVPALGGPERGLGTGAHVGFPGLDWSPDGRWLALVDRPSAGAPESIFLLSTQTGERRQLTAPASGGVGDRHPRFAPDGRSLAFSRWYEGPRNEIYVVPVEGGEPRQITLHRGLIRGLDWAADSSALFFSSIWQGTSSVWRLALSGELEQVSVGENARELSVSPFDGRLMFSKAFPDTNLWRVDGPARTEGDLERPVAEQLVASTRDEWGAQFSPDGGKIAFTSDRSGTVEVWLCDSDGGEAIQLTTDDENSSIHPRWSPDSRQIAFGRETEGNLDVWVVEAEGGFPRRLTDAESMDGASDWSPDGRWVYFFSDRSGTYEVWKVDAEGGEPQQVTVHGGVLPRASADGRFVYYLKQTQPYSIWKIPVGGGEESLVLERDGLSVSGFDVWGESLVYLVRDPAGPRLERLDLANDQIETVAELGSGTRIAKYGRISVSPDGRWVLYPRDDSPGNDLVLVEGLPEM